VPIFLQFLLGIWSTGLKYKNLENYFHLFLGGDIIQADMKDLILHKKQMKQTILRIKEQGGGNMVFHYIDNHRAEIFQTYQDLHACAEPSGQEEKTAAYLRNRLAKAGLTIQSYKGHWGFSAELPGEIPSEVVALRADMDAVVHEWNGKTQALHTCGHDGHSTMVMFTALALAASGVRPQRTVRFLFQPSEETGLGALQMMESGALDRVTQLVGIHVRPEVEVPDGYASPVILHGGSATLKGQLIGQQAHAARPHLGKNVLETAASLMTALQGIRLVSEKTYSVKMTHLQAGSLQSTNVIPGEASFALDLRAASNEGMEELKRRTFHVLENVGVLTETKVHWEWSSHTPAAVANEGMMEMARRAIAKVLGPEGVAPPCVTQGAEDFHFYTEQMPHLAATMIGLGCGLTPGLHHPRMQFKQNAMINGIKILTQLCLDAATTDS
jgi:amidohydrolase